LITCARAAKALNVSVSAASRPARSLPTKRRAPPGSSNGGRQNKAAKLIAATPVTIAPLPKPAPPQRLGLADLKRAALQRKAAAAS
jgi:hypothetical protein